MPGRLTATWIDGHNEAFSKFGLAAPDKVNPRRVIKAMSKDMGLSKPPMVLIDPDYTPLFGYAGEESESWLHNYLKAIQGKGTPVVAFSGPTAEAVVAHELGHAKVHALAPGIVTPLSYLSRTLSNLGPLATGVYLGARAGAGKGSSWIPALISAAVSTPLLVDEAAASLHALKYMREKHGPEEGLRRSAPLLSGYASYVGWAALPAAATGIMKLIDHYR